MTETALTVFAGLLGIGGVLSGAVANELLRRNRRIETYAARVFDVRLAKYEELMRRMHAAHAIASDVMDKADYSPEQRHKLISAAIMSIAEFTDENELYIDSDLGAHCVATFMGAEDIPEITDLDKKEDAKREIRELYKQARQMIRQDSGVEEVDRLFKKIAKSTLSGPIIEYIRFLRQSRD